jgi:ATP-dependent RNA helicase DDX55/SPB4
VICTEPARALGVVQVRQSKKGLEGFQQSEVDPDDVPYKDKAREKVRQAELLKAKRAGKDRCSVKEEKRLAREAAAAAAAQKGVDKKLPAAKRQLQQHREDLKDLEDDYRLLKKLKKGNITQAAYDAAMNLDE